MQNMKTYDILFKKKPKPETKVGMFFVYIAFALSLCVFGASAWFSSYAKGVYFSSKPNFDKQRQKIQDEILNLLLQENALTDVDRVRLINKELGLVEHTIDPIDLQDR